MNTVRFMFVFLFWCSVSWGMVLEEANKPEYEKSDQTKKSNFEAICNTINDSNLLEQDANDRLCRDVTNASDISQVWLNSVNDTDDLSVAKKLDLFEYIIKQDRHIKQLVEDITREKELRVKLINYFTKNIKQAIKKEKKIAKINNAIRLITSPDASYFYRGTITNGEVFDKTTSQKIQEYFISCIELTNNIIQREKITENYVSFGFDEPLNNLGFYTFARQVLNTKNKIKKIAKMITINEKIEKINKIIINEKAEKQKIEESEEEQQEKDLFTIDKDLVRKLIKTFFADCFSRAELPEYDIENENHFFTFFVDVLPRSSYQFDDIKEFVFDTAIDGSYRGVLLSIGTSELTDITRKKIKNFEKLSGIFFQTIPIDEKAKWDVFFNIGFEKFRDLYRNDETKIRKINAFEGIVHQVMTQPRPVPVQTSLSWKTKFAIAVLLSGSIFYTAYHLKHNQKLFAKYPTLQKLFPFLYHQPKPVQQPQSFFRELLPLE